MLLKFKIGKGFAKVGQIVNVPDGKAKKLIEQGYADEYAAPKKAVAKATPKDKGDN